MLFKFWAIVSRSSQREAWERRGRRCVIRYANIEADAANVTWGGGTMRQMKFKERGMGEHQRGGMNGGRKMALGGKEYLSED